LNDGGNAALNYNVLITILANVFAVFQQRAETIDISAERAATRRLFAKTGLSVLLFA